MMGWVGLRLEKDYGLIVNPLQLIKVPLIRLCKSYLVWFSYSKFSPKEFILLLPFLTHSLILVSTIVTDLWVVYLMILVVDSAVCSLELLSFFAVLTVLELACENTAGINVTAPISSPLCPQQLRLLLRRLCVRVCLQLRLAFVLMWRLSVA